jgi:hypothetical protein
MEIYVVIASINELSNIKAFEPMLIKHNCKVIVIDEGAENVRTRNDDLLSAIPHVYYGPRERAEWFKQRFGSKYKNYLSVIPERCHAETSFGFLVAYEERPDFVIELDDDVFPMQGNDIINDHVKNLSGDNGVSVYSKGKWYNTLENLKLNINTRIFPRGQPYTQETRVDEYIWKDRGGECVLNMGLWAGCPDLDALTILYHSGLDGRCQVEGQKYKKNKIIVDEGNYFAICSMNTSFSPEIVPAFYQLYMGFLGIDRFDDIWSGIFLKKIIDHLGYDVCLGKPLVYHEKRPRDTFKDLKKELDGIIINETLWKIVDTLEIEGKDYWDSYNSLAHSLKDNIVKIQNTVYQKIMLMQIKKMKLWLDVIGRIE